MIVRRAQAPDEQGDEARAERYGPFESLRYSDAGGLTQFGAYVETLQPGSRSAERHWHEREDELLYVIAGELTVVEEDGEHLLRPGDAACWPAGAANGHCAVNRSDAPCSYLIVGTRLSHDVCHYPDTGRALHTEGDSWRLVEADGSEVEFGRR